MEGSPASTIVVDPLSGSGTALDPLYQQVVVAARAVGVQMLGYIDTRCTTTPLADVERANRIAFDLTGRDAADQGRSVAAD